MKVVLFRTVAFLLAGALTFVLLEGITRFLSPSWLDHRMAYLAGNAPDQFGHDAANRKEMIVIGRKFKKFRPNAVLHFLHHEYEHEAIINAWGGRGHSECLPEKKDKVIPFLGDSMTFGIGVQDDETFVGLLDQGTEDCLLNLGIPGTNVDHHLNMVMLRHEELGKPPFYVFNIFLGNDVTFKEHVSPKAEGDSEAKSSMNTTLKRVGIAMNDFVFSDKILKRSYFIQFIRRRVLLMVHSLQRKNQEFPNVELAFLAMDRHHEDYIDGAISDQIHKMEQLARERKFDYGVIMIPDKYQVHQKAREEMIKYYGMDEAWVDPFQVNRLFQQRFEEMGRSYLDVTPCMLKQAQVGDLYFRQDGHLTKKGNQVVADCALAWLLDQRG